MLSNLFFDKLNQILDTISLFGADRELILEFFENPDPAVLPQLNSLLESAHVVVDAVTDEVRIYRIPDPDELMLL